MSSFEVVGVSSMEGLWARVRPEPEWPFDGPWLPAGATATDVESGRVRADARVEGPWAPSWPEIERELVRLGELMDVVVAARRACVPVRPECWEYMRGVHRAAAWTLGVTERMPLEVGSGPVTNTAIAEVLLRSIAWMKVPDSTWDAEGVSAWLGWLDGAGDAPVYPPGC